MNSITQKLLILSILIMAGALLYLRYNLAIYRWFCEHEANSASCLVTGLMYEKEGDLKVAHNFIEKSCTLKYANGCQNMSRLYKNLDQKKSQEYREKACNMGLKTSCSP